MLPPSGTNHPGSGKLEVIAGDPPKALPPLRGTDAETGEQEVKASRGGKRLQKRDSDILAVQIKRE